MDFTVFNRLYDDGLPQEQCLFESAMLPVKPAEVFDENGILVDTTVPAECDITDKRVQCDLYKPIDLCDPFAAAAVSEMLLRSSDVDAHQVHNADVFEVSDKINELMK